MTFSSAYLYAKQITAGGTPTPVLPTNVVFDSGVFNMDRMKTNFALDNIITAKDINSRATYSSGNIIITMASDYIRDNNGETYVNQGTDECVLSLLNGCLVHVGTSDTNANADGCDYYFPINFDTLLNEGYTKFYVTLDYSTQGIVSPTAQTRKLGVNVRYTINNGGTYGIQSVCDVSNPSFNLNDTATTTEHMVNVNFDETKLGEKPTFIQLLMTHGTYAIKKMWFE